MPRRRLANSATSAGFDHTNEETDPGEKVNRIHDPALGPERWRLERRLENWVKQYR